MAHLITPTAGTPAAAGSTALLPDHPQRFELNDEVHARPPEALSAPTRLSFLALFADAEYRKRELELLCDLARRFGVAAPQPGVSHYSTDFGPFRLTWERHTEFARYKVMVAGAGDDPFADPAIAAVPVDWLTSLPGRVTVASHAALLRGSDNPPDLDAIANRWFDGNALVGAAVAGGAAVALTDVRIRNGWSRLLVLDRDMTPRQAGRTVQRLLEIDTYRVMALLALPVARTLVPFLNERERELARITAAMVDAGEASEPDLLDGLTRLEAEIESRESASLYRFSAAAAYYELVQRRIEELRQQRIHGLQTFGEFTERRLAPAMNTCRAVADRQDSLSRRVARATQLLSTRVDVARERQNQVLQESANRRAQMQLRLQSTVQGLSVVAMTYYVVILIGHAAEGLKLAGVLINPALAMATSIPAVAVVVGLGLHWIIRRAVAGKP
jgi:uncharacterized membrane-anchored protein